MAKQRRGDDDQAGPQPTAEVPADEGFPVSTPPASTENDGGSTLAGATDGAAAEGLDGVAGETPLLMAHFTFHREFRRHVKTGDLVAIELVNGALAGVRRCSKPEEQTTGALPVMQLEDRDSDVGAWYRAEQMLFQTWEPPPLPKALLARLGELYEQAVTARSKYESAKLAAKHAKDRVEEVDTAIFHALRRMHDVGDQAELPLEGENNAAPELPLDAAEETPGDSSIEDPEDSEE